MDKLLDGFIERQVLNFRHQATIRAEIEKLLDALEVSITAAVVKAGLTAVEREAYRQARLEKLLAEVAAVIKEAYAGVVSYQEDELAAFVQLEGREILKSVNEVAPVSLAATGWKTFVRETLMSGAVLKEWWDGQAEEVRKAFDREMRLGLLAGETDAQLIARVRGTKDFGFKNGLMAVSKRRAKILVRGASQAVSRALVEKVVDDNPNVFEGVQQISVFDGRTSDTCISYAGKVWSVPDYKPVGHKLPYNGGTPRHPNCRSQIIPVFQDKYGGTLATNADFQSFLARKPKGYVDDLLGKGKAQLYRDGKITLNDLVDQNGRGLTLEQLKAAY